MKGCFQTFDWFWDIFISVCVCTKQISAEGKMRAERRRKETSETSLRVDLWRQTVKLQPWHFNWAQLYLEMNWLIATESFNSLFSLFISAKSLLAVEALIETCLSASPNADWRVVAPPTHDDGGRRLVGGLRCLFPASLSPSAIGCTRAPSTLLRDKRFSSASNFKAGRNSYFQTTLSDNIAFCFRLLFSFPSGDFSFFLQLLCFLLVNTYHFWAPLHN